MDEVRQRAAVVEAHSWAIGIEDSHDMSVDTVIAVIGHGHGLGKALRFVVNASRPDRIYMAPIFFVLRRDFGIAVAFARRREEKLGLLGQGQPKRVERAEGSDLEGRYRE